jgi:hypothetical protein
VFLENPGLVIQLAREHPGSLERGIFFGMAAFQFFLVRHRCHLVVFIHGDLSIAV